MYWRLLRRRAESAPNYLLSVLATCGQTPSAVFAQGRSKLPGERFHLMAREMSGTPQVRCAEGATAPQWGEAKRSPRRAEPGEDFRSIEQLGGGEVAPATSRRRCSMAACAPLGEMRAQRASRLTISIQTIGHLITQIDILDGHLST